MEKDGPLDGRNTNKTNKDSQMGQVAPKKYVKKIELENQNKSWYN